MTSKSSRKRVESGRSRQSSKSIHDPHYVELVARLRAARRRAGLSQEELAAKVGRQQTYISKVETRERRLDVIEALTLCHALGVSLEDLLPQDLRQLIRATPPEEAA